MPMTVDAHQPPVPMTITELIYISVARTVVTCLETLLVGSNKLCFHSLLVLPRVLKTGDSLEEGGRSNANDCRCTQTTCPNYNY